MKEQLYIPKEIRVGFQKREDTFTKKLAYVIYVDDKGKLRKEASWNSWCDKKIEKLSFTNEPTSGFMLNKNVQRYNWGHFSSNRSYIRVHDPRGFEFEISPENLLGILMDGNCNKRILDGDFVYSWHGTELVLLPCDTEGYKNSKKYTELQAKKVSSTDLVPGCIYRTKKEEDLIYLGKFHWYQISSSYKTDVVKREAKKKYIFVNVKNVKDGKLAKTKNYWEEDFVTLSNLDSIAVCVNEIPVDYYANLMDAFNNDCHSSKFQEIILEPIADKWPACKNGEFGIVKLNNDVAEYAVFHLRNGYNSKCYNVLLKDITDDADITCVRYMYNLDPKTNLLIPVTTQSNHGYRSYAQHISHVITTTKEKLKAMGISKLKYRLENGKITKALGAGSDTSPYHYYG